MTIKSSDFEMPYLRRTVRISEKVSEKGKKDERNSISAKLDNFPFKLKTLLFSHVYVCVYVKYIREIL